MKDYHINSFYSPDDEAYVADIPDFEMCSAFGATPQEALEQVISVKESMRKNQHVLDAMEGVAYNLAYLQVDKNAFAAQFTALPEREEIPVPVDEQLIVEFYTRLT